MNNRRLCVAGILCLLSAIGILELVLDRASKRGCASDTGTIRGLSDSLSGAYDDADTGPDLPREKLQDVLFYVRVNKAGSTMFTSLLEKLSLPRNITFAMDLSDLMTNRSRQLSPEAQVRCREKVLALSRPAIYDRHVYYVDFDGFNEEPLFLSLIRDPLARFVSRFDFQRLSSTRADQFRLNFPDNEPMKIQNQSYDQWWNKTLEECIMNDDRECMERPGDKVESQIAYICGQDNQCNRFGSRQALHLAKRNVVDKFIVIGVLERLTETFFVLENLLPQFMSGIKDIYDQITPDKSNIGPKKSHISAQAAEKLRNNLALEFDFYNFVNARLDQQIRDIQKNVKYRN